MNEEFIQELYKRARGLGLRQEKSPLKGHDFYNGSNNYALRVAQVPDGIWIEVTDGSNRKVEEIVQDTLRDFNIEPANAFLDELKTGEVIYMVQGKW